MLIGFNDRIDYNIWEDNIVSFVVLDGNLKPMKVVNDNGFVEYEPYSVENPAVNAFVNGTFYPVGYGKGTGTSKINTALYACSKENFTMCEHPSPVPLKKGHKDAVKMQISTDSSFGTYKEYDIKNEISLIYNLIPKTKYYYRTLNASGNVVFADTFTVGGRIRQIYASRVHNVRDVGGWKCYDTSGNTIGRLAYDKLIRGSRMGWYYDEDGNRILNDDDEPILHPVDTVGREFLINEIGITAELDLTGGGDADDILFPAASYSGRVKYINCSNLSTYGSVVSGASTTMKTALTKFSEALTKGYKCYAHCTWGADRTGTFCATVEALCGCNEDTIIKDWEMTSFTRTWMTRRIDKTTASNNKLRFWFQALWKKYSGATVQEKVENYLKTSVFSSLTDKGQSIIDNIRKHMVVAEENN